MVTEAQKRANASLRKRMREEGMKAVTVWLLPAEQEVLAGYCQRTGHSQNMAVQTAVLGLHHQARPEGYKREPIG